jgi:O-antigen/teichoic acid export membrane protein
LDRKGKLAFNTAASLANQIVSIVCGFILPRAILSAYGSEINGLLSSITQFLGFINLAECGVGAVVHTALYKPLAENDEDQISRIIISSEKFFRKIAYIMLAYTAGLIVIYPMFAAENFDRIFTCSLIAIISFSSFIQYYFSISYSLLLEADALSFIPLTTRAVTTIINTILSIILIKQGADIRIVKLASSIVFLIQPLFFHYCVRKHYHINKKLVLTEEPIKQKWNGLAQHIAAVVLANTDVAVLTIFSTLQNVSIYSVYILIVNGIKRILLSLTSGIEPLFGNMYAKNEIEELNKDFSSFEWMLHTAAVLFFTCTAVLIVPFVSVYTKGVHDANYIVPLFGKILSAAICFYCLRLPYNTMVLAAGHYKQTQASAIIEAVINIVISVAFVVRYGLVGIAIGTLVAMGYRTIYLAYYLSRNILNRDLHIFTKHIFVDIITAALILICNLWVTNSNTYLSWALQAVAVVSISVLITFIINRIFYREYINSFINIILKTKNH